MQAPRGTELRNGPSSGEISVDDVQTEREGELTDSIFEPYKPQRLSIPGSKDHPGPLVQSAAMASVGTTCPHLQVKHASSGTFRHDGPVADLRGVASLVMPIYATSAAPVGGYYAGVKRAPGRENLIPLYVAEKNLTWPRLQPRSRCSSRHKVAFYTRPIKSLVSCRSVARCRCSSMASLVNSPCL